MRHCRSHKRRKRKPKTRTDLERHTERRAAERYGIYLGGQEQRQLVAKIQRSGNDGHSARHLQRLSGRRSLWLVYWGAVALVVVYDNRFKALRTVMESRYSTEYREGQGRECG